MSHPCVVTLDRHSRPRALFAGDRLVEVALPAGTRCLYPKPPLASLPDVEAAISEAISQPLDCEGLGAKLEPGMKVTIALDDLSTPLPPMKAPDVRARTLAVLLPWLEERGIKDIEIIVATGLRRRLKDHEIKSLVGARVFDEYWPKRLYNHDPEDPTGMLEVGRTERGEVVELNRRAADSDLLIFVRVNFEPQAASHEALVAGLCGYRSLEACYRPREPGDGDDEADPRSSASVGAIERIGRAIEKRLDVLNIEITLDNRRFEPRFELLTKNEDELSPRERRLLDTLLSTSNKLPGLTRQAIVSRIPAPYGVTGVFAGETHATHQRALARCYEQSCVPVEGQADVLVSGIPYMGPYNVHSFLNPLLVQLMAEGYLFNRYRGVPLVKRGGTLIITHPCTDKFDHEQHAAHRDFVHRLLPEARNASELHHRYQGKLAKDPALLEMFRRGHAYHPAHPFFTWYCGEAARRYLGRVIVVGADNEYIPKLLGYETAVTMAEALYRARGDSSRPLAITCLHSPTLVVADVTPLVGASVIPGASS